MLQRCFSVPPAQGGLHRPGGHRLNCGDKRGLRSPRSSRGRHSAKPNDWPGGTSATLLLFVRTKSKQKGASPQGLDPLRFTGVFRTRSANEELRCPVNKNILRGSDLVVWRLSDSACRPLKGTEPAASGDPPNRCNANLHRTDVPQQGVR